MPSDTPSSRKPFTIFRSAAEEAEVKVAEQRWDKEGGRPSAIATQVTHVPGIALPYKVVLTRSRGRAVKRTFATMREAEAFIRRSTPVPAPALSTLYDRPAFEVPSTRGRSKA